LSIQLGTTDTADKPLRADARRNRAHVLEVARASFAEFGTELPMEELARRAGVGVGTVYRQFPNKEALLDALLLDQLTHIVTRTRAALEEDNAWQAFQHLVRDAAERQADDFAYCELIMSRKAISSSDAVARVREELEAETTKLLDRAKAEGGLRTDFTIADMPVLMASIAGSIRAVGSDGPWRRQLEFVLDGLRAS
jgi:AcrR family transcriptional regulator